MEISDHKNGVPIEYYRGIFAAADPVDLSRKSHVPFAGGRFELTLLTRPVAITWPDMEAVFTDEGTAAAPNIRILLGRLLMELRDNGRLDYELPADYVDFSDLR